MDQLEERKAETNMSFTLRALQTVAKTQSLRPEGDLGGQSDGYGGVNHTLIQKRWERAREHFAANSQVV